MSSSANMIILDKFDVASNFQSHIEQHVPIKLTEQNYSLWCPFMETALKSHDMFDMVTKTKCTCTSSIVDDENDQLCVHFIKLSLSEAMLAYIASDQACKTAKGLWLKLEEQGEIARGRETKLKNRLKNLKQGDDEWVSDYYDRAKELVDDLKTCGTWISDDDFVEHVLKGLPSCYVDFANWIRVGNIGGDDELRDLLVDEETNLQETKRREISDRQDALVGFACKVILFLLLLLGFICFLIDELKGRVE